MIEMLKIEEKKKKGGVGVSSKAKPAAETASSSKAEAKPTASELLAVKLRRKENVEKKTEEKVTTSRSVTTDKTSVVRCSTTDEELEALFFCN